MARRSTYELIDRILDGRLAVELRKQRESGATYDEMVVTFGTRGISVSRETLRRWCKELDIRAEVAESAA